MGKKRIYKLIFDAFLLVFLTLMYRKTAVSMKFHEWGGLVLGGLFLAHKIFNRKWIGRVTAGIFRGRVRLNSLWTVDLLLLIAVTAVLMTGLFISKTLPTALRTGFRLQMWHYFAAAVSLALAGVHLGLHWPLLRTAVWDRLPLKGKAKSAVGIVLVCGLLFFGTRSLLSSSVSSWLTRPFLSGKMTVSAENRAPGQGMPGRQEAGSVFEIESSGEGSGTIPERRTAPGTETAGRGNGSPGMQQGNGQARRNGSGQPGGRSGLQNRGGSFSIALKTVSTYLSVLMFFSVITALFRGAIRLLKQRRAARA